MATAGFETPIAQIHPLIFWLGFILVLLGSALRFVTAIRARDLQGDHRIVLRDLRASTLFLAATWSLLTGLGLTAYPHSDLSLLVVTGMIGLVLVGVDTFASDLPLVKAFVHLNMMPTLAWSILVRDRFAWVMTVIFAVIWLFVLLLSNWSNARIRRMFTSRIQLEIQAAELLKAKETAEEASRARAQFLANMSHEIRTPLNGVLGVVEILRETPLNPEQKELVEIMSQSGEYLLMLLNDVLDISKINSGNMNIERVTFDVRRLLADLCRPMELSAGTKGLQWTLRVRKEVPETWMGDPMRIKQILTNLIGNALKFTLQGGVQVEVGMVDAEHIRFLVKDTGIGIESNKLSGIFEAFEQADPSTTRRFGGTGLGLAISKKLAVLMGGSIGVESSPGQGSLFWLELGIAAPSNSSAAK